jgi:ABC-type long-subunit fatty acid transport system fused permease/ATPase subunit
MLYLVVALLVMAKSEEKVNIEQLIHFVPVLLVIMAIMLSLLGLRVIHFVPLD